MTKAWKCPHCGREFIVARDAQRDVCPWCKTTVEEKAGGLEKAPSPPPQTPTGASAGGGPSPQASGEMWWPYEYDPSPLAPLPQSGRGVPKAG